jgi:CubicO group peptidase (beta-lactamase class C family)
MMRNRPLLLAALIVVILLGVLSVVFGPRFLGKPAPTPSPPVEGWQAATPEEQGLDSQTLADGFQAMGDRGTSLHTLLVLRNSSLVLDVSRYPYSSSRFHNLASVTKSITTTLIAIAADQGKVDLDAPMLSYFPDRTVGNLDARKQAITVRHLAGMVNGFQSGCLNGDESTLDAMRSQPDWVQAALDRPMAHDPGERFCYDSPGMHLLSAILQEATGLTALDFARQYLFAPLGITEVVWSSDPQGYTRGWGDLSLRPSDALKIGYLWLNGGAWEGKQVVPADWVRDSVTAHIDAGADDYGYGWWVSEDSFYAMGRGGQTIKVMPAVQAVVVTTGMGLEYDEVGDLLSRAFVDPGAPLPANDAGFAELKAAVAAFSAEPAPQPAAPLPEIAASVSKNVYAFGPNELLLSSLRLESGEPAQAVLHLTFTDREEAPAWPVGLDNVYRFHGLTEAARGSWTDAGTFSLEVVEFTRTFSAPIRYQLRFESDRLTLTSPTFGLELEGVRIQE